MVNTQINQSSQSTYPRVPQPCSLRSNFLSIPPPLVPFLLLLPSQKPFTAFYRSYSIGAQVHQTICFLIAFSEDAPHVIPNLFLGERQVSSSTTNDESFELLQFFPSAFHPLRCGHRSIFLRHCCRRTSEQWSYQALSESYCPEAPAFEEPPFICVSSARVSKSLLSFSPIYFLTIMG